MQADIVHHAALDARLVKAVRGIKLLSLASWPADAQAPFLAGVARGQPVLPVIDYPRLDFGDARRELAAARTTLQIPLERALDHVVDQEERARPELHMAGAFGGLQAALVDVVSGACDGGRGDQAKQGQAQGAGQEHGNPSGV